MATSGSQVRVGVRIRPLTHQEAGQGGKSVLAAQAPEIRLGERRFTYDSVFDASVSQRDLYREVSAPLQTSFLDGYNATIMAYGQTGSGKTFTMGSEAHTEREPTANTGLIPRFMNDLFEGLEQKQCAGGLQGYQLEASFLEVYGEDVHDLLDPARASLPLREDSNGGVVCTGLTHRRVQTATQALEVLHDGTMNRTTAATLMNLTSSRSHAVFTVTLTQVSKIDSGVEVKTTSRFTFVDLAGSERMKKTGAEGERAREGIKINEGLLALGNVINALADEGRLAEGKKVHVPYRQSKLTRLLQDALGGNSQTLFLACVSPSDTNASETLSTLHYANRARNIKNAPTKNVDANAAELQRLQAYNSLLQAELARHRFGNGAVGEGEIVSPIEESLMMRKDVNDYFAKLHALALEKCDLGAQPTMIGPAASFSPSMAPKGVTLTSPHPKQQGDTSMMIPETTPGILFPNDADLLNDLNPDEEMAILDQLLEIQQKDQDFDAEQKKGSEELKEMEGELVEQESMLLQLKDSLKVYHNMKAMYEKLMAEVQQLEGEKTQLADQLEKASADPTQGCSAAIKKKLEKVERSLARARNETRKHRQLCQKAEREAQKCRVLERKIADLKSRSANLIKKQKASAAQHREYTEAKTREITALRKKERASERKMSKLQTEIQIHKKNLDKRQVYCKKLASKLKATESHLMKLLAMRNHDRTRPEARRRGGSRKKTVSPPSSPHFAKDNESIRSIQFLLDKAVMENVNHENLKQQYQDSVNEYTETMRSLVDAVKKLEEISAEDGTNEESRKEFEHTVEEKELKVELLGSELESLRSQLRVFEGADNSEVDHMEPVKKLVEDKDAPVLRTLLLNSVQRVAEVELEQRKLSVALSRKVSVIESFETEVQELNGRISSLSRGVAMRQSVLGSGHDPVEEMARLGRENDHLLTDIKNLKDEVASFKESESTTSQHQLSLEIELAKAREKVALVETALAQSEGVYVPRETLTKMQKIWEQLGISLDERSAIQREIENCLEDTCERKLKESTNRLAATKEAASEIESKIMSMRESMQQDGSLDENSLVSTNLIERVSQLKRIYQELEPKFVSAKAWRDGLAEQVKSISLSLGMDSDSLEHDLKMLLQDATGNKEDTSAPCNLREEFLSRCESQVTLLRIQKSKLLAEASEMQTKAFKLVSEMNLTEQTILPIVLHSIKQPSCAIPDWWQEEMVAMVVRAITVEGGLVQSSLMFLRHLRAFCESLESISKVRLAVSTKLSGLVGRAQKTLLKTVDGELTATEAYSSFHDALFKLPVLSKERIQACISEIDALTLGVDAMTQSEIEALTVVWEALNVSSASRGKFWGIVDDQMRASTASPEGPFHEAVKLCSNDSEEWLSEATKDASKTYAKLESRLVKLECIHGEVERQSAKQDAKSRIISLDSEIRILSAKLSEFEDKKCGKERLVTKKATSSNLLREERFRKQMQSKFSAKFELLATLLKAWRNDEGQNFETNLLSDEVCLLLSNSDKMDNYVEKRTEFMHLRTTLTTATPKRGADEKHSTARKRRAKQPIFRVQPHNTAEPRSMKTVYPPLPSTATKDRVSNWAARKKPPVAASTDGNARKRKFEENGHSAPKATKFSRATRQDSAALSKKTPTSRQPLSPSPSPQQLNTQKIPQQKKRLTLPPFAHVLEQSLSPKRNNKENGSRV